MSASKRISHATRSDASTLHVPDPGRDRGHGLRASPAATSEAAKRKQVLRVAIERDFETLRPELSAGDTANLLRRLIYTTPILWGHNSGRTARSSTI